MFLNFATACLYGYFKPVGKWKFNTEQQKNETRPIDEIATVILFVNTRVNAFAYNR